MAMEALLRNVSYFTIDSGHTAITVIHHQDNPVTIIQKTTQNICRKILSSWKKVLSFFFIEYSLFLSSDYSSFVPSYNYLFTLF
jgi:hypothetical protein